MTSREQKIALRDAGYSHAEIAKILGISKQAVSSALAGYEPKLFRIIRHEQCVFFGLRNWMNENKISVSELARRCGYVPYPETHARITNFLNGKYIIKNDLIDKIINVTGLTYEEAFGTEKKGEENIKNESK